MTTEKQELIEEMAYSIWLAEGCPTDKDLDHWLRAEEEVIKGNGNGETKTGSKRQTRKTAAPKSLKGEKITAL